MKTINKLLFCVFLLLVIIPNIVLAADMTIDIKFNNSLALTQDTIILFNEQHIAPGAESNSEVKIRNNIDGKVNFYLDHFEVIKDDGILEKITFEIYEGSTLLFSGKFNEIVNEKIFDFDTISNKDFKIITCFDRDAGNKYQNNEFEIKVHFRAELTEPENIIFPDTGESRFIYYALGTGIVLVIFFIIIVYKKQREEEDEIKIREDN